MPALVQRVCQRGVVVVELEVLDFGLHALGRLVRLRTLMLGDPQFLGDSELSLLGLGEPRQGRFNLVFFEDELGVASFHLYSFGALSLFQLYLGVLGSSTSGQVILEEGFGADRVGVVHGLNQLVCAFDPVLLTHLRDVFLFLLAHSHHFCRGLALQHDVSDINVPAYFLHEEFTPEGLARCVVHVGTPPRREVGAAGLLRAVRALGRIVVALMHLLVAVDPTLELTVTRAAEHQVGVSVEGLAVGEG